MTGTSRRSIRYFRLGLKPLILQVGWDIDKPVRKDKGELVSNMTCHKITNKIEEVREDTSFYDLFIIKVASNSGRVLIMLADSELVAHRKDIESTNQFSNANPNHRREY